MKALQIRHKEITREGLLSLAEETPGAWIGMRISGLLLMLSGWSAPQVASLFGLSRWSVVKWSRKANNEGLACVYDKQRPGRPSQFDKKTLQSLDKALAESPRKHGFSRTRWDGTVVVEYLKRFHQISIHVRHAQRLMGQLGYTLRQPVYQFVQASDDGVKDFRATIKKTRMGAKRHQQENDPVC